MRRERGDVGVDIGMAAGDDVRPQRFVTSLPAHPVVDRRGAVHTDPDQVAGVIYGQDAVGHTGDAEELLFRVADQVVETVVAIVPEGWLTSLQEQNPNPVVQKSLEHLLQLRAGEMLAGEQVRRVRAMRAPQVAERSDVDPANEGTSFPPQANVYEVPGVVEQFTGVESHWFQAS